MKNTFIHKEIWLLTTMGGFQRANLYNKSVQVNDEERRRFRDALHAHIKHLALTQYDKIVAVDIHIENIKSISSLTASSKFSYLLNNGQLNFGVSQKLLNLYLKYLWCIDAIVIPPHFPVDRIIQVNLNKEAKKLNLERRALISWTQMENEGEYIEVIDFAVKVLNISKFNNLAELELHLFERI